MFNKQNALLWAILIGAIAGIVCGWFFGEAMLSVRWIGQLFLDALKMTIIPLIVAAVVSGVASLGDIRNLGRLGGLTVFYYACTTGLAVFIGLIVVNIMQPGVGLDTSTLELPSDIANRESTTFTDIILSLVHPNIVAAAAETKLLPIIVFSLVFTAALTTLGDKGKPVLNFFESLNEVMMKLVIWLMYLAPLGIFALIAARLGSAGGGEAFFQEIKSVGLYVVTVIVGLGIHFILLFFILCLFSKRGLQYLRSLARALFTAFGTASSSATLPLTMECATESGVNPKAVKFVLPLGATINMDGTALYEAVAVMFIAQAYNMPMDITQQIIIFVTATLAAIGAAGIPQAGLVTMLIVLSAVNIPVEGIALLLAVDWFLDRIRTMVNVWGDSVGAAVLESQVPNTITR